jgi:hypothetical protein
MRAQGLEPWTYGLKERCPESPTPVFQVGCGDYDSLVATLVATKTPANTCESLMLEDDPERLITTLPADLARLVSAWPQLSESLRQAVLAIVENALGAEPRAGSTAE